MGRKRTHEEIEEIVNSLGYTLMGEYRKDGYLRVAVQDSIGYKYDVRLDHLEGNPNTIRIAEKSNPFIFENVSLWLSINNPTILLCDDNEFISAKKNMFFHCTICNEDFPANWGNISQGRKCPFCRGLRASKHNSLAFLRPDLAEELSNENQIRANEVTLHSNKHLDWICKGCGHHWNASVAERTAGRGCPACSNPPKVVTDRNRLSVVHPELVSEWHPTKNENLTPDDVSYACNKKVWWICPKCRNEWKTPISNRSRGSGCPACKNSRGEMSIRRWLEYFQIEFMHQARFDDCRNLRPLPFDFYLPYYNLCIEYHGEQHYRVMNNDKFGGIDAFNERVKHDKLKEIYCKENDIHILIIPYWEYDNIKTILEENLFSKG